MCLECGYEGIVGKQCLRIMVVRQLGRVIF